MSSYGIEMQDGDDHGEVHVALTGELDLTNAGELELGLDEIADGGKRLAVDLNGVSFLDSAALHVLFKLARRCGRDRLVFVVDPGAHIATTLEIVGLANVATTRPSSDP
jgi:anti-anti-sigma factor